MSKDKPKTCVWKVAKNNMSMDTGCGHNWSETSWTIDFTTLCPFCGGVIKEVE